MQRSGGAELAVADGPGLGSTASSIGAFVDEPNLTDKKFPGNPTKSYRSREPRHVTGEVKGLAGPTPEQLKAMKDHLDQVKQRGVEAVDD